MSLLVVSVPFHLPFQRLISTYTFSVHTTFMYYLIDVRDLNLSQHRIITYIKQQNELTYYRRGNKTELYNNNSNMNMHEYCVTKYYGLNTIH